MLAGSTPSPSKVTASLRRAMMTRLVKNPRLSLTTIGVLPSCRTKSNALARGAGEGCSPLQLGVLEDGLHHEVDAGQADHALGGMDAGQQRVAGVLGGAAGLDRLCLP